MKVTYLIRKVGIKIPRARGSSQAELKWQAGQCNPALNPAAQNTRLLDDGDSSLISGDCELQSSA